MGRPMKVSEQRKHIVSEKSSSKLSSELFAFTMGVSLCTKKTTAIPNVKNTPNKENSIRIIPIISSNDKNSTSFVTHVSLCLFDQNSGEHLRQITESEEEM